MTKDTPAEFHLENYLPYLVHRVGSRLAEGFDDLSTEADVSLQEWRALSILYEFGPQTMGDISRRTSINASTMTRLVGQMEKRALVQRERPVGNQRTVHVRILEAGRNKVEHLIPRVIEYENGLSECFSNAELQTFKSLLTKFFLSVTAEDKPESDRENRLAG